MRVRLPACAHTPVCAHVYVSVCPCVHIFTGRGAQGGHSLRCPLSGFSVIRADASKLRVNCKPGGTFSKLGPPPPALLTVENQGLTSDLHGAHRRWVQGGLCVDMNTSFPVWILSIFWVRMHICQNPKNQIRLSTRTIAPLPGTDVLFLVRTQDC